MFNNNNTWRVNGMFPLLDPAPLPQPRTWPSSPPNAASPQILHPDSSPTHNSPSPGQLTHWSGRAPTLEQERASEYMQKNWSLDGLETVVVTGRQQRPPRRKKKSGGQQQHDIAGYGTPMRVSGRRNNAPTGKAPARGPSRTVGAAVQSTIPLNPDAPEWYSVGTLKSPFSCDGHVEATFLFINMYHCYVLLIKILYFFLLLLLLSLLLLLLLLLL
jgi:hypothetical protein